MKILILTAVYPPLGYSGHDERCRQTVRGLVGRGHHIQVLTSDHRLPPMGVDGEKGIFRELHLHPAEIENSLLGHSYKATYSHERYNAESLEYRLRRFKPDMVYVWNMRGLSKSLLFHLQDLGVRMIYDLHADWMLSENFNRDPWYRWWYDNPSLRSKIYRLLSRMVGKTRRALGMLPIDDVSTLKFDNSYVISQCLKDHLIENGFGRARELPVMYPAVDTGKLSAKIHFQSEKHFMWAGRIVAGKGADLAVDAVGLLKKRGIYVKLDLFGMGTPSERKAKRARIESLGLIDRVTMRGIRAGELSQHYVNYDALLYTARVPEPFSMTVLEASLSRLPCIVARIGGNPELLTHGQNAVLFEAGSVEALADAMAEFLNREDGGEGLAIHDFQRLHAEQNTDMFCDRIEAMLA